MKYNEVNWAKAWRGLALTLLRDEGFDHEGKSYLRLSGGVIPLVPRDVREVSTYRQSAVPSGSAA